MNARKESWHLAIVQRSWQRTFPESEVFISSSVVTRQRSLFQVWHTSPSLCTRIEKNVAGGKIYLKGASTVDVATRTEKRETFIASANLHFEFTSRYKIRPTCGESACVWADSRGLDIAKWTTCLAPLPGSWKQRECMHTRNINCITPSVGYRMR